MNKILTTAALALMMTACSNDYNEAALQPGAGHEITVTATIDADGGSTLTRTVAESGTTITSSLTADEEIAVLFSDGTNNLVRTATVKSVTDGTATIEFTIPSSLTNNTACTLVYPATAANADNTDVKTYAELFATQTGVLSDALDVRRGTATILNDGFTASLSDATKLAAQNAIVKFSLSYGSNAIAAKTLTVKDGDGNTLTTVKPSEAASDLYVAMAPPATAATFRLEASDGTFLYIYEKSGVTLAAGKYYQSPVTLDVVEQTIDASASGFSGTYDEKAHGISVTVNSPTGAVVKYGQTDGIYDLDDSPTYTDAGNYTVYYQVTKDKYTTVTGSAEVKIAKADMTVSATDYTGTYDEKAHGITVIAPTGATVKYGTSASSCTEASLTYTDADTYTVYYEVTKDNYNTVTGSATVKINKAAGSIRYGDDKVEKKVGDVPFNNPLSLSGTASVSYSSDNINVATVAADGTVTILSTGTATITATVTSSTNYSYSLDYAQYTLTVKSPNSVGESGGYTNAGDPISNN